MENHHFLMAKSTIYINGPCSSSQTVNVYQRISWLVSHNSGYQYHQYDLIIIFMVSIYCYHNIMSIIIMSSMSNRISIPLICHNIPLIYHWYPMVFFVARWKPGRNMRMIQSQQSVQFVLVELLSARHLHQSGGSWGIKSCLTGRMINDTRDKDTNIIKSV